jgi:hypothetical protein
MASLTVGMESAVVTCAIFSLQDENPDVKLRALEKKLDDMKKAHEGEVVSEAVRQVRTTAAHWTDTSSAEQLVAPIEHLARTALQFGDKEATLYGDLAVAVRKYKNSDVDLGMLVLNVLGGADMDRISKAIAKSQKRVDKDKDKKEPGGELPVASGSGPRFPSPLAELQHQYNTQQWLNPYGSAWSGGPQSYGGYRQRSGYGYRGRSFRGRGAYAEGECRLCGKEGHRVVNCPKLGEAKSSWIVSDLEWIIEFFFI